MPHIDHTTVKITVEYDDGTALIYVGRADHLEITETREMAPIYNLGSAEPSQLYTRGKTNRAFTISGVILGHGQGESTTKEAPKVISYHRFDLEE